MHDCNFFSTPNAVGSEIYGSLVYDSDNHGMYVQSDQPTMRITENILFNNNDIGLKAVSQNGNSIGFDIEGNTSFNNRSVRGDEVRSPNIEIGANNGIADQDIIIGNYLYHPPGTAGATIKLGYDPYQNRSIIVRDNYIMSGGVEGIEMSGWQQLSGSGNTIFVAANGPSYSNKWLLLLNRGSNSTFSWNNNTYYNLTGMGGFDLEGVGTQTFQTWKQTIGDDNNSTYQETLPPNKVIVKPNVYEAGRATVIIYNWTHVATVNIDLSLAGLSTGQRYKIVNAQNYHNSLLDPVMTGTFNAANPVIALDLTSTKATAIVGRLGYTFVPATTLPEFGVFVVVPNYN
jgi:hypothetical protein